jgi:CspA family cold shock protein
MNLLGKLVISLLVAAVASTAVTLIKGDSLPDLALLLSFCAATVATALLVSLSTGTASSEQRQGQKKSKKPVQRQSSPDSAREQGEVKWFNVSKGFGFITKDNGEEIFVHFRSIRGEGRRSLRDGQRVTFVEAQSDKGPQAEDVEPL